MRLTAAVFTLALFLAGCTRPNNAEAGRTDADNAAYKLGRAAHAVAVKTEKAAKVAGAKLKDAAESAHEGWKDSKKEAKQK